MMRASKPITVTLGKMQEKVDARVKSGEYSSASEVLRAGLRALEFEEEALKEIWRRKIEDSLSDPRPDVPMEEVFERLERKYRRMTKAGERGA